MNAARTIRRSEELSPSARRERAERLITEGVRELVKATLAIEASGTEYVHQGNSSLGRRKHLRLWNAGVFKSATQDGRQRLVLRSELNEYLEKSKRRSTSEDEEVDDILDTVVGGGRS